MATVPNYFLDAGAALPTNPFQSSMMDGLRFGATMQDFQAAQVKRQQEQQDRELKLQTQQRAQEQQAELQTLLSNPTPASTQELLRFSASLPKDQSASVMAVYDKLTTQQQQSKLKQAGQIYASIKSGNLDVTKSLLQEQADGFRNNGNEAEAKAAETYIQMLGINPASAQNTIGLMMAVLPGGKEALENIDKTLGTTRAEQLQPTALRTAEAGATEAETKAKFAGPLAQASLNLNAAQIKNINSEIRNRAAKLNLDAKTMAATVAEKLSSIQKNLTELPADTRKLVNESAVAAAASKQAANQYLDLAKRLEAAGGGFGTATSFADYLRKSTGNQNSLTSLRQEYTRIRNSAAIKSLPPGVATDKDIELALKGIPPENADAGTIASFLRGLGKMQDVEASVANAKTDWLASNNGVLTRAKDVFQAGDYATKSGESFNDFTQRIASDISAKYRSPAQVLEEKRLRDVAQIPTIGTAPVASPSVRAQADAILRGGQ